MWVARACRTVADVKIVLLRLLRWLNLFLVTFATAYLTVHFMQRTGWFQERVYRRLLHGSETEQRMAAAKLAQLGAENWLLTALQADSSQVREFGRRGLEHVWCYAAGEGAYRQLRAAHERAEQKDLQQALSILNHLVAQHPKFAEARNKRASVYWELGEWDKSLADSRSALDLNPHHYGAWQGLGLCRLKKGEVAEACQALRAALRIAPYDESTRTSLRECENLLRTFAPRKPRTGDAEVI